MFAAVPGVLVLLTAVGALVYQCAGFVRAERPKYMLAAVAVILLCLAVFVTVKGIAAVRKAFRREGNQAPVSTGQ